MLISLVAEDINYSRRSDLSGNNPRGNKQSLMQQGRSRKLEQPDICMSHQGIPSPFGEQESLFQSKGDLHNHTRKTIQEEVTDLPFGMEEMALSGNEQGGNRLPTFNQRRIQSEVRVPGGQEEREVQHSRGRTEGRQRSRSREPSFLGEARKKRRIEELEEELKLLKGGDENREISSGGADKARVIQARVEAHILFLAQRGAAENQITDAEGSRVPKRRRSRIQAEGSSRDFTLSFLSQDRASKVSRSPKEIDSLLALTMKVGETLKSYSTRYWEVYNDIDACDEDIVVKTFRFGLHEDSKLRKSFTRRPPVSMAELMTRLEEHIRVEDDPKSRAKTAEVAPLVDRKAAQPEPRGESRRARKAKGFSRDVRARSVPGRVHDFQRTDLSAPPPHQG
uniref:Uncharacterized protein n=1 Tax=Fagus sylvatica TaxID=28930 RepID=A0A2N9FM04_FAGSY